MMLGEFSSLDSHSSSSITRIINETITRDGIADEDTTGRELEAEKVQKYFNKEITNVTSHRKLHLKRELDVDTNFAVGDTVYSNDFFHKIINLYIVDSSKYAEVKT